MSPVTGESAIVLEWTFVALSASFLLMRIFAAHLKITRQYRLADAFCYAGYACSLAIAICDTMLYSYGAVSPLPYSEMVPTETIIKICFTATNFYNIGLFFPKASILAFYFDFIPITYPRLRQALVVVAIYVACAGATTFLSGFVWCPQISDNW
ncbi:hypothetical protein BP6252_11065 [Coleophoma cylindrospora]|uniref:Rhodopsin domain-containing protein n=1 Tax=Coleophoma cylindrospora TaxID=1849047 RepID=A0A3D8QPF6_9HELO|nr:hypothetical protein BP6252_11065 [Coleophoma cylindrospora]